MVASLDMSSIRTDQKEFVIGACMDLLNGDIRKESVEYLMDTVLSSAMRMSYDQKYIRDLTAVLLSILIDLESGLSTVAAASILCTNELCLGTRAFIKD